MNSNNIAYKELKEQAAKLKPYFVRAAYFSLISSLLALSPSVYMLEVYDRVVNSRNHLTLAMLTVLVLGAYLLMEFLEWVRSEVMHEAAASFEKRLRTRVFNAAFSANLSKSAGGNLQPFHDLRNLRDFIASATPLAVFELPIVIVLLAILFAISSPLGWFTVFAAVVQAVVAWFNETETRPPLAAANMASISTQQFADNSLRNAEVIESMGMSAQIYKGWHTRQSRMLALQARASDKSAIFSTLAKFWQQVVGSALLGLGCWALFNNQLLGGSGMMIIASILGGKAMSPLVQIVTQWQSVVNAREAWHRLGSLLNQTPLPSVTMKLPAPRGELTVDHVFAAAPGQQNAILRGVSFQAAPGEVVAVVGPSASGKTSLARLLIGVWPSSSGKVRLDGADIYSWNKEELGPHVGYMPQSVQLFDGTIAENIARFGPVDQHMVEEAARSVGLHDSICALEKGYNTLLGVDGTRLSGGQRQRVALARAMYGNPVLVVLDEPNSSLDEAGDAALSQMIQQHKTRGCTFVVITHRTSILNVTDKMVVLKEGRVQAFGTRDEVLNSMRAPATGHLPKSARPLAAT